MLKLYGYVIKNLFYKLIIIFPKGGHKLKEILIQTLGILLNILPYFFLCYTPVWNILRIKRKTVLTLVGMVAFINVSSIILIMTFIPDWNRLRAPHSFIFLFIYMFIYILTVKIKPSKLIFILFIVKGYSDILVSMAKFFETNFFPYTTMESYKLVYNIIVLLLLIITFPPMWILLKRKVSLIIESDAAAWKFLWIIPTTIYSMIIVVSKMDISIIKQWQFFLFDALMLIGSYLIYYVTIEMLLKTQSNTQLKERINQAENQISMQLNQYEQLGSYIESTRKLNHDMRHHLVTLQGMAARDNCSSTLNYLSSIISEMPLLSEIILCKNYAVNALLAHYKTICENEGIEFNCSVNLNSEHAVTDKFLCVIFGNCLENALEACLRMKDGYKFIRIVSKLNGTNLFITIDNSFDGNILKSNNGFLSSKRNNKAGIGLSSIKFIAEKYNGSVEFSGEGKIFKSNIFLDID